MNKRRSAKARLTAPLRILVRAASRITGRNSRGGKLPHMRSQSNEHTAYVSTSTAASMNPKMVCALCALGRTGLHGDYQSTMTIKRGKCEDCSADPVMTFSVMRVTT